MAKTTRCTIDSGWVGGKHRMCVDPDHPSPHSIMVEEGGDVKLFDFVQDGEWWTVWKRDVVGFVRPK